MDTTNTSQKLTIVISLLAANLLVVAVAAGAMVFGLLPKIERVVLASERVESRFQSFADEVQPVMTAGAAKTIETIKKIDADQLSKTATDKTNALLDSATERAKRYLERDKAKQE